MKIAMAELELGADEAVKNAKIGGDDGNGGRGGCVIGEAFGKNFVEVVADFGFEQDGFERVKAEASADAGEIGIGLGEAKIVGVNAGLDVIVLCERNGRQAESEEKQHESTLHGRAP